MEELSIFVDESGDFGEYDMKSPYYIVTMVFHKQSIDLQHEFQWLTVELQKLGLKEHCIHVGPIIRREAEYRYMNVEERRKILNKVVAFTRCLDIRFQTFCIQKKQVSDEKGLSERLSKTISSFIQMNYNLFLKNDICTFELIRMKLEQDRLSKSECLFFGSMRDLKNNLLEIVK